MSEFVNVTVDGEDVEILTQPWMNDADIACEAAKYEYDNSGPDLADPSCWPRDYIVNGKIFSVDMEYNPEFYARQNPTQ